ncbi:hypothetical protein ACFSTC_21945 [Nonomuraea ferruginea]
MRSWTSADALLYAIAVGAEPGGPADRAGVHHREHRGQAAAGPADLLQRGDGRRHVPA